MTTETNRAGFAHAVLIVVVAMVAHGLMLLIDGLYWDDWLLYFDLTGRRWENVRATFAEAGIPTTMYLHWWMGRSPAILLSYRLLALLAIITIGLTVYKLSAEFGSFDRHSLLLLSLIAVTYPAVQVNFELINIPSLVSFALFLIAALLAVVAEQQTANTRHYLLRLVALLLFFLVFGVNSLLVFYFGFLLLFFVYIKQRRAISWKEIIAVHGIRRLDLIALPFVYWAVKQVFFPKHGIYANYNNFNLTPLSLAGCAYRFVKYGVVGQFTAAAHALIAHPIVTLALLIVAFAYAWFRLNAKTTKGELRTTWITLAFGLLLLGLGAFPYVAVGLWPPLHGWDTRHALLIGLPVAIVVVATYRLIASLGFAYLQRLTFVCVVILMAGFTLAIFDDYLAWQARWVKDRSVMLNLQQVPAAKSNSIFWIDDQFPKGQQDFYRFYEWSSMFKNIWGDESHVGLDPSQYPVDFLAKNGRFFSSRYNLSTLDPEGCQAKLTIYSGQFAASDGVLAERYLSDKLLHPERLDEFLRGVTQLELEPVASPVAVHCVR